MNENKKKIAFIINPISGTQSKEQILKWLDEKLDKERYAQEVIYTERAGHAVEIAAQKAQEDAHAVIAIGGDGTINEIARSLVHTKTALGIIPCGSGNGLARHLQIPMEPKKAIDIINDGLIDIIDFTENQRCAFLLHLRRGIRRICKPAILQGGKERTTHLSGKDSARKPEVPSGNL